MTLCKSGMLVTPHHAHLAYVTHVGGQLHLLETDSLARVLMADEWTILFPASRPLCVCNISAIVNVTLRQTKYLPIIIGAPCSFASDLQRSFRSASPNLQGSNTYSFNFFTSNIPATKFETLTPCISLLRHLFKWVYAPVPSNQADTSKCYDHIEWKDLMKLESLRIKLKN